MGYFAVIDTETNWENQVMSIGTIIADSGSFKPIDAQYHVLTPEYEVGGSCATFQLEYILNHDEINVIPADT